MIYAIANGGPQHKEVVSFESKAEKSAFLLAKKAQSLTILGGGDWCQCRPDQLGINSYFVDDEEHYLCLRHHHRCLKCHGILQVG